MNGNFVHCTTFSVVALSTILDDFGNVVMREGIEQLHGFLHYMKENDHCTDWKKIAEGYYVAV